MSQRLEFHTVANLFPMIDQIGFEALKSDIQQNGLIQPIYLYQNKIIDGRNRYLACLAVGVEPIFRNYEGAERDLLNFVISLNLQRRHLGASQKACLAVELLPELEKRAKESLSEKISILRKEGKKAISKMEKHNSIKTAGAMLGVSDRLVSDARNILKEDKELFEKVKNGELTLYQANKRLKEVEVFALMQKDKQLEPLELSKTELRRVAELVEELGISEEKARNYVVKRRKQKIERSKQTTTTLRKVEFRITEDVKNKLHNFAKLKGKPISEVLRNLLEEELK